MKKIKSVLKALVSVVIVMLGSFLTHFYLSNEISVTSIIVGTSGFIILFPAIKKWHKTLWNEDINV
jgi:hypothetical protein